MVLDAEHNFEPAILRTQFSALPAELWRPSLPSRGARSPILDRVVKGPYVAPWVPLIFFFFFRNVQNFHNFDF